MAEVEGLGLAPDRERYKIEQSRSVEIRVGVINPDQPGSPVEAWPHCITCDDVMYWTDARLLFECEICGHTVSRTEAKELCSFYVDRVEKFSMSVMPPPPPLVEKRKRRWYFLWLW